MQSVRKLANTLRQFAEEKAGVKLTGDMHCYPWSFRHAAWLLLRYRVINGSTSFEFLTDRRYVGKVALWGETVLFKDVASFKRKGDPVYRKGVWVGKSSWSDSHICLTRSGAVEARSIRRLPEQFDGQMLVRCRGLPWQYSVQGILMKTKFAARQRVADRAEEATGDEEVEKEAKAVGEQVAVGMYGHALGPTTPGFPSEGHPKTPARTPAPPTPGNKPGGTKTPGTKTPMIVPVPATPAAAAPPPPTAVAAKSNESSSKALDPRSLHRLPLGEAEESPKRKIARLPIPEAMRGEPAGNFPPGAHEVSPKRQRLEDVVGNLAPVTPPLLSKRGYALPWDDEDDEKRRMSPKRRVRSIQEEFPGGDEMIAEEALQHQQMLSVTRRRSPTRARASHLWSTTKNWPDWMQKRASVKKHALRQWECWRG